MFKKRCLIQLPSKFFATAFVLRVLPIRSYGQEKTAKECGDTVRHIKIRGQPVVGMCAHTIAREARDTIATDARHTIAREARDSLFLPLLHVRR